MLPHDADAIESDDKVVHALPIRAQSKAKPSRGFHLMNKLDNKNAQVNKFRSIFSKGVTWDVGGIPNDAS
jgi:hypothetical protein